jgi:hypothetical protein
VRATTHWLREPPLGGFWGAVWAPSRGVPWGVPRGVPGGGAEEPPLPGGSREGGLAGWEGVWMGAC